MLGSLSFIRNTNRRGRTQRGLPPARATPVTGLRHSSTTAAERKLALRCFYLTDTLTPAARLAFPVSFSGAGDGGARLSYPSLRRCNPRGLTGIIRHAALFSLVHLLERSVCSSNCPLTSAAKTLRAAQGTLTSFCPHVLLVSVICRRTSSGGQSTLTASGAPISTPSSRREHTASHISRCVPAFSSVSGTCIRVPRLCSQP